MRISYFIILVGNGCLITSIVFDLGLYTMQEPSYLGKDALISICYRMVLTLIMTWVYKDALTLTHPPNISIWLVLQFWYPWAGSFILLLMLIIDTMHPSVFWSNIGSNPMLHANGNIGFMPLFLWTLIVLFSWFVCWEAGIMCRTLHEQPSWMGCFGACLLRVLLHFSSSLWYPWYVWPQNVLRTHCIFLTFEKNQLPKKSEIF